MRIIAFIEDYKIVKKILDYLGIYKFGKKRAPPKINTSPDEFDDYIRDDYIDCDLKLRSGSYFWVFKEL